MQIHRQEACPTCHGQSNASGAMICPECNGTGKVTQMGGRMKFDILPALQRNGEDLQRLRHMSRRGRG